MSEHSGNIGKKTFLSAIVILLVLLVGSGMLTHVIPTGSYEYQMIDGKSTILADSFQYTNEGGLAIYKWLIAPIEALTTSDGLIVIMIIMFLLIIGGSIHVLNEIRVLTNIIGIIIKRFGDKRYLLMGIIIFVFMSLGAFIGIFEEVIPLVPIMIALSLQLGWDKMTGLGMSLLAAGFGFSAAVSNPFTIGVAQQIAGIPMFSGAVYRIIIFAVTYTVLYLFLRGYSKSIDRGIQGDTSEVALATMTKLERKSLTWFLCLIVILLIMILLSPIVPIISSLNLPIIGLIFLVAGIGSALVGGIDIKRTGLMFLSGSASMLPGVVLILLATGVKHVIQTGGIMDTILYYASNKISGASPFSALLLVYGLVFVLNFFIGSGSAKAFLVVPIIMPLMGMIGVSKQMAVLAFQFGDGFSNILYPTNAVLLIGIGLAGVSYTKWLKWVAKIQLIMTLISVVFLYIGLLIQY